MTFKKSNESLKFQLLHYEDLNYPTLLFRAEEAANYDKNLSKVTKMEIFLNSQTP
jgi:hypothetical protein